MSTCDYNAIVPIKKRRFPLIQSSIQKEISSLPPLDDNIVKVGEPCFSDGQTVLNSSTIPTSKFSAKEKVYFSEEGKRNSKLCNAIMVQSNIEPTRVEFQEDGICLTGSRENKVAAHENHVLDLIENSGLMLPPSAPNSNPGLCAEKKNDEIDRRELDRCNFVTSIVNKEAELSVGLKEHLVPGSVLEGSDWKCQKQNSSEPVLLNLSLSKQGSHTQCLTDNVGSNYDGSLQHSNRKKWDLNTSMEFWEDSSSDDPPVQVPVVQTNTIVTTHSCSTEMVKTDIPFGKLTPLDHSSHLHLSFSSSDVRDVTSHEQSPVVKLDFRKTNPSLSSDRGLRLQDVNGALKVVKREQFIEGSKREFKSDEVNGLGLLDNVVVKRELDDQCSLQIPNASDIFSPINTVKAKSIKSESIYESKQEPLRTLRGSLDLVAKQVLPEVDNSYLTPMLFVAEMSEAAGNPSCSTDLVRDREMSNDSELQTPTKEQLNMKVQQRGYGCGGELVKSEMTDINNDPCSKDSSTNLKPIAMPVMAEILEASNPSCSTDLIIDGYMSNEGGYGCGGGLINSEMTDVRKDPGPKDSSISVVKPYTVEDGNQNKPLWRPLKLANERCSSWPEGEEGSVSDEERISISADLLEEDPYSSEYESDAKQEVNEAMDVANNDVEEDYEDGEVREPMLNTQVERGVCEKRKVKVFYHSDCSSGLPSIDCSSLVSVKQEKKLEIHDVKREDNFHSVTSNQSSEPEKLKELLVEENTTRVCTNKANNAVKATGTRQSIHFEKVDVLEDREICSEKATNEIEELNLVVPQSDAENVKTVDFVQNEDLDLPNVKEPLNYDDVTDDFTHGSRHRQIGNSCQASTSSSPSKTRSNLVKSVLTQNVREQMPELAHEGDKLLQGRYDPYRDVSQKFYVNRHQNQSVETNFTRRRGRFTIRINSVQGEWDFNPTISPGMYNDQIPPYDSRRRKYSDDDIDQNHYRFKPDGPYRSAGNRSRQMLDDEGSHFCHVSSRRSPGRRDGPPPVRGVNMVHRVPRNISPGRCIRESGSELVGPRHREKFMRTLEDETMDPIYAHLEPPFEVDRPLFMRDRRNFPVQRKSFRRVDSRSPGRSRGGSPRQCFPSRGKSDRFFGHPEMTRRSPSGYRMRSPDHPPPIDDGDMPIRRHGFPFLPLPPNDLRDMGPPRDRSHMRSGIRSRNRTDRMSFRNNRRFEDMDPRDGIENSEFFDGPVHHHPSQLNELGDDGNNDNRRRFPERHEHLPPYRPQCNDSDGENYHNDVEERPPRPFRYCAAEDEHEYHERGRFDRRLKNQQGNLARRTTAAGAGIEEQQHEVEDYRHGRRVWNEHHGGFEDISRLKRKRF